MEFIKGITFAPFAAQGSFRSERARKSLKDLQERTSANLVILVPNGLQDHAQSERIDFTSKANVADEELREMIRYAKSLGLQVALKPTVNCKNGTWRAHINFFDHEVHCEPKWSNWFQAYTAFQMHYARIAEEEGCEMMIAGCEMVMSERRADEWRALINEIKKVYHGLVSYNTDKYQEDNVTWWDVVDVISSSGYYPLEEWEKELDRIEKVVEHFKKPFFFAEAGCMSTMHSSEVPNDWGKTGEVALEEQAAWYEAMFKASLKRPWVGGFAMWDWPCKQYELKEAINDKGYTLYGKPAEKVIKKYYSSL